MKNHNVNRFLYLAIFVLIGFNSCKKQSEVNLGGNYYFIPFEEVIFDVSAFNGNGIFVKDSTGRIPVVFPDIVEYKYGSSYITVKQKFNYIETRQLLDNIIFMRNSIFSYNKNFVHVSENFIKNAPNSRTTTIDMKYIDSIMHKDENIKMMMRYKESYFIILKANNELIGPLTKRGFNLKVKALNLPERLNLD